MPAKAERLSCGAQSAAVSPSVFLMPATALNVANRLKQNAGNINMARKCGKVKGCVSMFIRRAHVRAELQQTESYLAVAIRCG